MKKLYSSVFFAPLQSGFRPRDSTVNQLIFMVHKIYEALERGSEGWGSDGFLSSLLSWFGSYLTNRKQRVVIDGTMSDWKYVQAGVPLGSVLGPLLFLVYINDITDGIQSTCFLYANDTFLLEIVEDPQLTSAKLNSDLTNISKWTRA